MEIIDKAKDKVKAWLWSIALKKFVKRAALLIVAWLSAHSAAQYGFSGGEVEVTAVIYLILDQIKSFIKTKWPKVGAWL